MDALKRWRQPAAFVVLGALVARLGISIVGLVVLSGEEGFSSAPLAASPVAFLAMDNSGLLALALLVAACALRDPTPQARPLAAASVVVSVLSMTLTLVLALVGLVVGWGGPVLDVLALLTSLVAPAVATVGLVLVWRHLASAGRAIRMGPDRSTPSLPPAPTPTPTEDPRSAPTWQPHEASGVVWHTAGAAASGAAASAWGDPDGTAGWNPVPGPAQLPPGPGSGPAALEWAPAPPAPAPTDPWAPRGEDVAPGWPAGPAGREPS
jgi:hypothetical protein